MWKSGEKETVSKKKKRDMHPYPALRKELNLKTRQDEIEIDYLHKLTKEEAEYINKFNEEYVNATLDRKDIKKNLHATKPLKQSCDKRNNERKECAYTRSKASNNLKFIDDYKGEVYIDNYEDVLIDKLDRNSEEE